MSSLKERLLAPISKWVGNYFGFAQSIEDLIRDTQSLRTEVQSQQNTINGMHKYYMEEYRRIESAVLPLLGRLQQEEALHFERKKLRGAEHLTIVTAEIPRLLMAATDYENESTQCYANMRYVETTTVRYAFALEPMQKRDDHNYKRAVGLAKKASELVYDAVMCDCGQRPKPMV